MLIHKTKGKSISNSLVKRIFFGFMLLLLTLSTCIAIFVLPTLNARSTQESCKLDSELYQVIHAKAEDWTEYFPDSFSSPGNNLSLRFSTPSGNEYVVYAEYWTTESGVPVFYVSTHNGLPSTPLGIEGLFYTPTGQLPVYGVDEIVDLGSNIYCYKFR